MQWVSRIMVAGTAVVGMAVTVDVHAGCSTRKDMSVRDLFMGRRNWGNPATEATQTHLSVGSAKSGATGDDETGSWGAICPGAAQYVGEDRGSLAGESGGAELYARFSNW